MSSPSQNSSCLFLLSFFFSFLPASGKSPLRSRRVIPCAPALSVTRYHSAVVSFSFLFSSFLLLLLLLHRLSSPQRTDGYTEFGEKGEREGGRDRSYLYMYARRAQVRRSPPAETYVPRGYAPSIRYVCVSSGPAWPVCPVPRARVSDAACSVRLPRPPPPPLPSKYLCK